jgi:hypothetical protein
MPKEKADMIDVVIENCKVTIRVPVEILKEDVYAIRIEDENGLVLGDQDSTGICWRQDHDFSFAFPSIKEIRP